MKPSYGPQRCCPHALRVLSGDALSPYSSGSQNKDCVEEEDFQWQINTKDRHSIGVKSSLEKKFICFVPGLLEKDLHCN